MIRNFLIDIGNVLLAFDLAPAVRKLNHRPDLSQEQATALLVHHRDLMEAGAITSSQFLDRMICDLAYPGLPEQASAIYADIFTENTPMWDLVEALEASGHRLVLFSNTGPIHADFIARAFPRYALFKEAILSYRSGAIKPHDGMYREAVETLGMVPRETFYVDDNPENIATGLKFGFACHLYDFHRHDALLADLAAAGVDLAAPANP